MLFALIIIVIFLLGLLTYTLWQNDRLRRRNNTLSRQIADIQQHKDMVEKAEKKQAGNKVSRSSIARMDGPSMYQFLSQVIREEKLFLDPAFGRQTLNNRFGLSYNQIGRAFSSAGTTLPAFITDLRLEYACKLLLKEKNRSISDIASRSGFTSSVSFGRSFKQRFAVTPSEYRQEAAK